MQFYQVKPNFCYEYPSFSISSLCDLLHSEVRKRNLAMCPRQIYILLRETREVNSKSSDSWATTAGEVPVHIGYSWTTSWSIKTAFYGKLKFMPVYCNNLGCNVNQFSSPCSRATNESAIDQRKESLSPARLTHLHVESLSNLLILISLKKGQLL